MLKSKTFLCFIAALIIAPILIWVVEFNLVELAARWKQAPVATSRPAAPPWVQKISEDVAKALKLPVLEILLSKGAGEGGHASLEKEPYTIEIEPDFIDSEKPQLSHAIIAHEYGHFLYKKRNLTSNHFIYFVGNAGLLVALLFCLFLYNREVRGITIILVGASVGGLIVNFLVDPYLMASTCIIVFVAIFVISEIKSKERILHFSAVMLLGFFLYVVGIQFRNFPFRNEEIFADKVSLQLVGVGPFSDMLCVLFEDHKIQSAKTFPLDRWRQEWQDLHPLVTERAKAQGVAIPCY